MLWDTCAGKQAMGHISGTLLRLVESQAQVATLTYVDTLEEQSLLESMLNAVKPAYPEDSEALHYLLRTPFRYPPLPWGSRYGRVHEPSIFYGGGTLTTTLAESAYYRFVFWYSMEGEPVKDSLRSEHTLISADYGSDLGVRLQLPPFSQHTAMLMHPQDYAQTQLLGSAMRDAGVEAFEYPSARDIHHGICVGLFTPKAFPGKRPRETSQWLCELRARDLTFKPLGVTDTVHFAIEDFLYLGRLPMPA